jgi:hypothetical protein
MTAWTTDDIVKRFNALKMGPKHIGFDIVYDEANKIWLGKAMATIWSLDNESTDDRAERRSIAAFGAAPAEVLRKLAALVE